MAQGSNTAQHKSDAEVSVALWDGRTNGAPVPDGSYAVLITAEGFSGRVHQQQVMVEVRR